MRIKLLVLCAILLGSLQFANASFPVQKQNQETVINGKNHNSVQSITNAEIIKANETAVMESPAANPASGKSQLIALILCIAVGALGIHRFYLGYIWQGVVQLLTLGGCGIWTLIDLIMIITGDLKPKNGDYTETL